MNKPILKIIGCDYDICTFLAMARMKLVSYGFTKEDIDKFDNEAMSGDDDKVLETLNKWFKVE